MVAFQDKWRSDSEMNRLLAMRHSGMPENTISQVISVLSLGRKKQEKMVNRRGGVSGVEIYL